VKPLEYIRRVLGELEHEAVAHLNEWAEEHPQDGTGGTEAEKGALVFREACLRAFAEGRGTWRALVMDRLMFAFAETQHEALRDALLDAAGMLVAWVVAIEQRDGAQPATPQPFPTLSARRSE
jgi:hypothetical protein